MKQCTGCDRFDDDPLGLNPKGQPYLACCPDSNYVEITSVVLWMMRQKDLNPDVVLKALKIEDEIKINEWAKGYNEGLYDGEYK